MCVCARAGVLRIGVRRGCGRFQTPPRAHARPPPPPATYRRRGGAARATLSLTPDTGQHDTTSQRLSTNVIVLHITQITTKPYYPGPEGPTGPTGATTDGRPDDLSPEGMMMTMTCHE